MMATEPSGADVEARIDLGDRNVSWYDPKIKQISASGRELLENYSKIPPAEVEDHVFKIVSIVLRSISSS